MYSRILVTTSLNIANNGVYLKGPLAYCEPVYLLTYRSPRNFLFLPFPVDFGRLRQARRCWHHTTIQESSLCHANCTGSSDPIHLRSQRAAAASGTIGRAHYSLGSRFGKKQSGPQPVASVRRSGPGSSVVLRPPPPSGEWARCGACFTVAASRGV